MNACAKLGNLLREIRLLGRTDDRAAIERLLPLLRQPSTLLAALSGKGLRRTTPTPRRSTTNSLKSMVSRYMISLINRRPGVLSVFLMSAATLDWRVVASVNFSPGRRSPPLNQTPT